MWGDVGCVAVGSRASLPRCMLLQGGQAMTVADACSRRKRGESATALRKLKCTASTLKESGYNLREAYEAGYSAMALKEAGV